MFLDNNINIKVLNVDVHSEINPTSIVLYSDSLDTYQFIFKLLDGNTYFVIPDTTKLTIKINGKAVPTTEYIIADKYRGTIKLKLNKTMFFKDGSEEVINTTMANIISLELYSKTTFGMYQYTISIPITVTTGQDLGDSSDTGTTKPDPDMPSPSWNVTQGIGSTEEPGAPENPDEPDDPVHLIFDGGSFF